MNARVQSHLDSNSQCEDRDLKDMGVTRGDSTNVASLLEQATLEHFTHCVVPQLKAFCRVRLQGAEPSILVSKKKGTVDEAKAGVENLIFLAHSFRDRTVQVAIETDQELYTVQAPVQPTVIELLSTQRSIGGDTNDFSFVTAPFIVAVIDCFSLPGERTLKLRSASRERITQQACQLTKILFQRLRGHLQERIQNENKRRHWCLRWAASNLPRVAAIMVAAGHITDDLDCFTDSTTCLLQNPLLEGSAFLEVDTCAVDCQDEGCYLYFDKKTAVGLGAARPSVEVF